MRVCTLVSLMPSISPISSCFQPSRYRRSSFWSLVGSWRMSSHSHSRSSRSIPSSGNSNPSIGAVSTCRCRCRRHDMPVFTATRHTHVTGLAVGRRKSSQSSAVWQNDRHTRLIAAECSSTSVKNGCCIILLLNVENRKKSQNKI